MSNKTLWLVYLLYLLVSGYTMAHHEPWADEVHSWNLAKGSRSYPELISNRRFEGHPPGWHTLLWGISRFTHNVAWMQAAQWTIACLTVFLLLFFAPFPSGIRILLSFGYYFLFEYGIISRNYGLAVLLACCLCLVLHTASRYKLLLYYILLFLLSNIHLLSLLLAAAIHGYFLLSTVEEGRKRTALLHTLAGALVFLPAVFFIFPPADSSTNIHFWWRLWNAHQLLSTADAPLRAFLPVPAWWNYHFWNTQCLIVLENDHRLFKFINPMASLALLSCAFFILRRSPKALALFGINLLLNFALSATVFALITPRYAGFIFIGFVVALWLYCYERPLSVNQCRWAYFLLSLQLPGAVFTVIRDIQLPFSNLSKINELIQEVPPGARLVTDYWTMNGFVAFTDKPAYCIDMQRELSYVLWGPDMAVLNKKKYRYASGLQHLFQEEKLTAVYMISQGSQDILEHADARLHEFHIAVLDTRQGAIEKGGDLYLYKITL